MGFLLHGICYDFFFVTGSDLRRPQSSRNVVRASAQGFIAFITLGVGMFIGAEVSGWVVEHYSFETLEGIKQHVWDKIWLVPAIGAGIILAMFAFGFRDSDSSMAKDGGSGQT